MAKKPTVDGFIPRRSQGMIGEHHSSGERKLPRPSMQSPASQPQRIPPRRQTSPTSVNEGATALRPTGSGLTRADIDESLKQIDTPDESAGAPPRKRGGFKANRRKIIKRAIIALAIILLLIGAFVVIKAFIAGRSVFKGDLFGLVQAKQLKMDENGRSNILIVGTSEDDPGHQGADLTDSIMVLSVDQNKKNAYMISVPRDLEAKYGRACVSGYAGKVNVYFSCVNGANTDEAEQERQTEARKFFGEILGLEIQYSAHVNYSVLRDTVAALGGITVTIESTDPRGQMDSNFDWKCKGGNERASLATMKKNCPPNGHFIDYPNGPANLDAEHALYLAQARGDAAPTYGFERSNFDREQNQQKIIKAIKEKALSSGTLTNLGKVTGLIDALGNNLRTNFDTSEIATLISLAQKIPNSSITSLDFQKDGIMTDNAQPAAGLYQFGPLQAYINKKLNATAVSREGAHVVVLNGSGISGIAQAEADKLTSLGMEIDSVDNAPAGDYTGNTIYQIRDGKPETAKKLSSLYGAKLSTSSPVVQVGPETDFVLIVVKPTVTPSNN